MAKFSKEKLEAYLNYKLRLGEIFDIDPDQTAALLALSYVLFQQGEMDKAKKILTGLAFMDDRNPYPRGLLGTICQREMDYDNAITHFTWALWRYPNDINSLTNRGECYLKIGKLREALEDLTKAIELDTEKKDPNANRARFLLTLTQEALAIVNREGIGSVLAAREKIKQQMRHP